MLKKSEKRTNIPMLLLCDKAHFRRKITFSLSFGKTFRNKRTDSGPMWPEEGKKERKKIKMLFIFSYVTHDLMPAWGRGRATAWRESKLQRATQATPHNERHF